MVSLARVIVRLAKDCYYTWNKPELSYRIEKSVNNIASCFELPVRIQTKLEIQLQRSSMHTFSLI